MHEAAPAIVSDGSDGSDRPGDAGVPRSDHSRRLSDGSDPIAGIRPTRPTPAPVRRTDKPQPSQAGPTGPTHPRVPPACIRAALAAAFARPPDAAEERAAIMEYEGGLTCEEAERLTLAGVECPAAARVLRERWGMAP